MVALSPKQVFELLVFMWREMQLFNAYGFHHSPWEFSWAYTEFFTCPFLASRKFYLILLSLIPTKCTMMEKRKEKKGN